MLTSLTTPPHPPSPLKLGAPLRMGTNAGARGMHPANASPQAAAAVKDAPAAAAPAHERGHLVKLHPPSFLTP